MSNNGHENGSQSPPLYEAPASLTLEVEFPGGWRGLFTLRDSSGAMLLEKAQVAIKRLEQLGCQPAAPRGKGGSGGKRVPVPADGSVPSCPEHQTPMRPSNYGGFYCAHKDQQGNYCTYKAR